MANTTNAATAWKSEQQPRTRSTSISAHLVTSVCITMSSTEMDLLCKVIRQGEPLSHAETQVREDFLAQIEAVR
jgi:hypothetical protein